MKVKELNIGLIQTNETDNKYVLAISSPVFFATLLQPDDRASWQQLLLTPKLKASKRLFALPILITQF